MHFVKFWTYNSRNVCKKFTLEIEYVIQFSMNIFFEVFSIVVYLHELVTFEICRRTGVDLHVTNFTELSNTRKTTSCDSKTWQHITKEKIHYRIHKSRLMVYILSQINKIRNPHLISSRSITIFSTHLRLGLLSHWFPSRFPTNIIHAFLFSPFLLCKKLSP
jgi:hypothetical protein